MRSRRAATSISYQYQASSASNPTPEKEKRRKIGETGGSAEMRKERKEYKPPVCRGEAGDGGGTRSREDRKR